MISFTLLRKKWFHILLVFAIDHNPEMAIILGYKDSLLNKLLVRFLIAPRYEIIIVFTVSMFIKTMKYGTINSTLKKRIVC